MFKLFTSLLLVALAACTTTSGPSPSIPPGPPVYVDSFGGYDLTATIPPLALAGAASSLQSSGTLSLVPVSDLSVCPRVEHYGCVVQSGGRLVAYIDSRLPAWAREIFGTALFGHAIQIYRGLPHSHVGWTSPLDSLLRSVGAGSSAGSRPAAVLTYAHTWGGEPPEPYASAARRLLDSGAVEIRYRPLSQVEDVCGRNRQQSGWIGAACQLPGPVILIANEVPPSARPLIELHESAHAVGWPDGHPGALKPAGHLDACIRSMDEAGLTLRAMRSLCNLDAGAPLRTQSERDRLAALR